jgi:hypothetical protein
MDARVFRSSRSRLALGLNTRFRALAMLAHSSSSQRRSELNEGISPAGDIVFGFCADGEFAEVR